THHQPNNRERVRTRTLASSRITHLSARSPAKADHASRIFPFPMPAHSPTTFDFVILGSGIAGLSFALKVAPRGRVAIITKKDRAESNTNYAQGGIAAVTSKEDSFELHVRDTLEAGAGLCKEPVVRTIIEEGPARIAELIDLGMHFSEREIPQADGSKELDL